MKRTFKILFCLVMIITFCLVGCNNKPEEKEKNVKLIDASIDTSGGLSFAFYFQAINANDATECGAKIKLGYLNKENMSGSVDLLVMDELDSEGYFRAISNPVDKSLYNDYYTILPYVKVGDQTIYGEAVHTTIYDLCSDLMNRDDYEKDRNIEKVVESYNNYESYYEYKLNIEDACFDDSFVLDVMPYASISTFLTSVFEIDTTKVLFSTDKAIYDNASFIYLSKVNDNLFEVSDESKYTHVLSYSSECSDKCFNDLITNNQITNIKYVYVSEDSINFYDINPISPNGSFKYKNSSLPTPIKEGYEFTGWVMDNDTYKCNWIEVVNLDLDEVMSHVSDTITSYTNDTLPLANEDATFEWSCSIDGLYNIDENGNATISRIYQTHKKQEATITVKATLKNGSISYASKTVTVDPVVFDDLPSTPIATYFAIGSISAYMGSNPRYKEEKTLFSESTKKTLDILYYAFANTSSEGNISVASPTYVDEVIKLKDYNVRIIISLSATSGAPCKYFAKIGESYEECQQYAVRLMDLVEKYNFDGVDIDWESCAEQYTTAKGYNNLAKAIREEMDKRQDENGTNYMLTAALAGTSWATASDRIDFKTLNNYLDYVNAMTYDSNNEEKTTHLDPLNISSYDYGYGFGCSYAASRFSQLGLSKSKIILGIAGYGKAYTVTGTVKSGAVCPGLGVAGKLTAIDVIGSFASGTLYGSGIEVLLNNPDYIKYDEYNKAGNFVGSYMYNPTNNIFVTYDSELAVEQKYDYANKTEGMGLMCWSYSEDTYDRVIDTISKKIGNIR